MKCFQSGQRWPEVTKGGRKRETNKQTNEQGLKRRKWKRGQ